MNTRRTFIGQATGLPAAASAALGANASSAKKVVGANDRIRIALIGCGGMAHMDLGDILKVPNTECVGLCDVDDSRSAEMLKTVVAPTGQQPSLITRDFRRILERKDLDAVIVATPDHWHALIAVMACQAGKDVYVEKPLSVSIGEGRIMLQAARKYERVMQMGTQQRSARHYQAAVDFVKSGKLGKIRTVRCWAYMDNFKAFAVEPDQDAPAGVDYDFWLGPAPKRRFNKMRFHGSFRWFWDYSGGLMTDWGAHMIDIANWGMNVKAPNAVMAGGGKYAYPDDAKDTPDTQNVLYEFPDFLMIWEHGMGVARGPEARGHGVSFHGSDGVLVIDREGWEIYPELEYIPGQPRHYKAGGMPRQSGSPGHHAVHIQNFIDCMRSRKRPNSDVELSHNSMIACHLGNIAFRLKRRVQWDVEGERVIGDAEAQQYVMREYRAPWKLTV